MRYVKEVAAVLMLLGSFVLVGGCGPKAKESPQPVAGAKSPAARIADLRKHPASPKAEEPAEPVKVAPVAPPKPTEMPKVALSAEILATCRVNVGDTLPDAELPDPSGGKQSLAKLFGKKLTVVFFWQADNDFGVESLEDENGDVAKPYADKGVNVIGISYKDPADKVKNLLKDLEIKLPVLLDSDGKYFDKLASAKILRTYLVDSAGKILWFDVEYSRSTRRDLIAAIEVALTQ